MITSTDSGQIASSWERWVLVVCRLAAVGLGVLHTTAAVRRFSMNADGISYLDIGDLYLRGDWGAAVNSVWSPMYSWILGSVLYIFEPSARWEFAAVQFANLAIYLVALLSFEFFWRQLMTHRRSRLGRKPGVPLRPAGLGMADDRIWSVYLHVPRAYRTLVGDS